ATYARGRDNSSFGQSSYQELEGGSPHQPDFGARHRRYRCSLPGLTGFTTSRREGADTDCHGKESWRTDRDSNPGTPFGCYLLSKQAPSTARPSVRTPMHPCTSRINGLRIISICHWGFGASAGAGGVV